MITDISLKYVLSYRRYASCYCSMLALHDRPVLAMVSISCLELYQLLQYLYVCSSVMFVHPEGGVPCRTLEYPLIV